MERKRYQPPQPDRIRSIHRSFRWIDHRFFRQGFDQALTRTEKLLYLVLAAVSNREGVSLYSGARTHQRTRRTRGAQFDRIQGQDLPGLRASSSRIAEDLCPTTRKI